MKDPKQPEPWHKDDARKSDSKGGAPLGTPSFTGASANLGMPRRPAKDAGPERSNVPHEPRPSSEADAVPLEEPRATGGDMLGRKDS